MLHFRSLEGLQQGLSPARARTVTLLIGLGALLLVVIAVGAPVASVPGKLPPVPDRQSAEREPSMKTYRFEVERLDYPLPNGTFDEVIAAFEREVPAADLTRFAQLVSARAPAAEIENGSQDGR
jgi:hypothetical protein